jgi:hypothetical protein
VYEIGRRLQKSGRLGDAAVVYRQVLQGNPGHLESALGLGEVLTESGEFDDAVAIFRTALGVRPEFGECWTALGHVLRETGALDESIAAYRRAVELEPFNPSVHNNLGGAYKDRGELGQAIAEYQTALSLRPDFVDATLNLSLALLLGGDFRNGFALYEARRELREPNYTLPRWMGEPLGGRRVLLFTRQGLGDVIHFVRYAPMVEARGGRAVVVCKPQLRRLLEGQAGIWQVATDTESAPAAELQCPLLSLPLVFGTTMQTIPSRPYLKADARISVRWRAKLEREPRGLKVGLNWAGNPIPRRNRKRTFDVVAMTVLSGIPGVRFYSLQKGDEIPPPPPELELIDWTSEITDMADTAALIANLDLVITCDTSVAHLAGALGAQTWVGLPFAPDWRWLLGREDSPWYPTMQLFRQPSPSDWNTVIHSIASELAKLH